MFYFKYYFVVILRDKQGRSFTVNYILFLLTKEDNPDLDVCRVVSHLTREKYRKTKKEASDYELSLT